MFIERKNQITSKSEGHLQSLELLLPQDTLRTVSIIHNYTVFDDISVAKTYVLEESNLSKFVIEK